MQRPEQQTPIYKKAQEIQILVKSLTDFIRESDLPEADVIDLDLVEEKLLEMEENAQEIPLLILEASISTMPYDFRMENAVFVKSAALEIIENGLYIEDMGLKDIDYLDLLYDEIEMLRILFLDWIKTFELWKYDIEDWGLFAPEGIKIIEAKEDEDEDDFRIFEDDDDDDLD